MSASKHTVDENDEKDGCPSTIRKIQFIVTGFGPFNGIDNNPTTTIVTKLVQFLRTQLDETHSFGIDLANNTRTLVIETSAEAARSEVDRIAEDIRNQNPVGSTVIIVLHLGVNSGSTQFALEECAYNEATFRVPDERGFTPDKEAIPSIEQYEVGTPLPTLLDIPNLIAILKNDFNVDHSLVTSSTDPGRIHNQNEQTDGELPSVRCLFMHVPPFSIIPESMQFDMVLKVMQAIASQVVKSNN